MAREDPEIPWSDVWDALLEHHEQLRAAAVHALGPAEADDLVHSFAVEQLPRIIERTASLPAARRQAYIRAAFRNYMRSGVRKSQRHQEVLRELRHQVPQVHRGVVLDSIHRANFREAVLALSLENAQAISLYLGVDGETHSLRDIANSLDISRYRARQLVLDGFLALASILGIQGALSPIELRVCGLLINHHLSTEEVATRVGITPHQVRSALQRARNLVGQQLS